MSAVKFTAVRELVWKEVQKHSETFSLHDIEQAMPYMDRSSIFRALKLFAEHHMLHELDDGSGQHKYCVCRCDDHHHHTSHVHFACTKCGTTYCLENIMVPHIHLPEDFTAEEVTYVVKGVCRKCK